MEISNKKMSEEKFQGSMNYWTKIREKKPHKTQNKN